MYIYIYIYTYAYMHTCIHTYIHTRIYMDGENNSIYIWRTLPTVTSIGRSFLCSISVSAAANAKPALLRVSTDS